MENKELGTTSTGIQPNVAALLAYLLGWVTGLIFFLIEKDNKFVRFHAMQSMIVFGFLTVLNVSVPFLMTIFGNFVGIGVLIQLIGIAGMVLWIVLMVKAYQGESFKLPISGDIAEKQVA